MKVDKKTVQNCVENKGYIVLSPPILKSGRYHITAEKKQNRFISFCNIYLLCTNTKEWKERIKNGKITITCDFSDQKKANALWTKTLGLNEGSSEEVSETSSESASTEIEEAVEHENRKNRLKDYFTFLPINSFNDWRDRIDKLTPEDSKKIAEILSSLDTIKSLKKRKSIDNDLIHIGKAGFGGIRNITIKAEEIDDNTCLLDGKELNMSLTAIKILLRTYAEAKKININLD